MRESFTVNSEKHPRQCPQNVISAAISEEGILWPKRVEKTPFSMTVIERIVSLICTLTIEYTGASGQGVLCDQIKKGGDSIHLQITREKVDP